MLTLCALCSWSVQTVMLPELLSRCVVAIVLDMSEPESALTQLLSWVSELRKRVEAMQQELNLNASGAAVVAAARKATDAVWAEHPDAGVSAVEMVSPIGVPLVFVCHKWDAFAEAYTEGEQRKALCRTLRFLAHQVRVACPRSTFWPCHVRRL